MTLRRVVILFTVMDWYGTVKGCYADIMGAWTSLLGEPGCVLVQKHGEGFGRLVLRVLAFGVLTQNVTTTTEGGPAPQLAEVSPAREMDRSSGQLATLKPYGR